MQINKHAPFTDAPGTLGTLWGDLATAENELAELLLAHEIGSAIVADGSAWYLEEDSGWLNLVHSEFKDGATSNAATRFDVDLDWVDVDEESLTEYIRKVESVIASFDSSTLIKVS